MLLPARGCERLLFGIEPLFLHVQNIAFTIHKCMKNMASISARVGIHAALFSGVTNCLPPTPLMTLPMRHPVIRPSFTSIADTLREEFANKG